MNYPLEKENRGYSYSDYLHWPEDERWEIIEGVAYNISPAPSRWHQKNSVTLASMFFNYLQGSDCEVYAAPFDVRLPEESTVNQDIKTVVQPDILVVCDQDKLDDAGCLGSPDLIVEIISPSTASKDHIKKLALYEKHGVKEYWTVHPTDKIVMIYQLTANGSYGRPSIYAAEDKIAVALLKVAEKETLIIDLQAVFA